MLDCGLDSDLFDLAVLMEILTGGRERDELSSTYCVFFGNRKWGKTGVWPTFLWPTSTSILVFELAEILLETARLSRVRLGRSILRVG